LIKTLVEFLINAKKHGWNSVEHGDFYSSIDCFIECFADDFKDYKNFFMDDGRVCAENHLGVIQEICILF